MDNFSSPRVAPLGSDAERDPQPPPGNNRKKNRDTQAKAAEPPEPEQKLDLILDVNLEQSEQHQLDERA
jgi:hypothetical protein